MSDTQAELAGKLSNEYANARNRAYGDAINQLTGADTLLNNSRTNTMGQYTNLMTAPMNAYSQAISNSPLNSLTNASNNANNLTMLSGTNQGALYQQLAQTLGTAFTNKDKTPTTIGELGNKLRGL